MLDVLALLRSRRTPAASASAAGLARSGAAKERPEEVGERIFVAEEVLHLLLRHRPVAAGAAHVDRPGAVLPGAAAAERIATGETLPLLLRLLVHAPVRAEL